MDDPMATALEQADTLPVFLDLAQVPQYVS